MRSRGRFQLDQPIGYRLIQQRCAVTDLWIVGHLLWLIVYCGRCAVFPLKIRPIYWTAVSHGWVFLICSPGWWDVSLSQDIRPQLSVRGALLTLARILLYENIDHWCFSVIDKWQWRWGGGAEQTLSAETTGLIQGIPPAATPSHVTQSGAVHPCWCVWTSSHASNVMLIPAALPPRLAVAYYHRSLHICVDEFHIQVSCWHRHGLWGGLVS